MMSILLLVLTLYLIATGSFHPHDYILITRPNDQSMNWISAQQYCHNNYASNLATILSQQDIDIITKYSIQTLNAMIGLQYNQQYNIWSWINDGSSCNHNSFCNQLFEPNTDSNLQCSQIIMNPTTNTPEIHPIDCNTPYTQFFCDKS